MLRGHLDVLLSAGYIDGWAYDVDRPETPLQVMVVDQSHSVVASGLSHLYREDLVDAGCGIGWCGFRLRVFSVSPLRKGKLILVEASSGVEITCVDRIPYQESGNIEVGTIEGLILSDPTMTHNVEYLKGCDVLFRRYILKRGVEAFVRAAYVYMLSRPVDTSGLRRYARMVRVGVLSPFELLQILADSEEFHSRPRLLGVPNASTFAMACD